ncbi:hypothetical protein JI735_33815 (plasmid) [Paenibacillus sonchi]|uniref:Uncharacterized protein n=1 Tax=Paenibacillus sonchi TaxID=373687 RepID=A0A974SGH0_9BACL|nr:hypothetical protein [Paenibacillus sonchi]QQZ64629.1 hypothetical protein JI735_33815 [Paenibacillus sonchi]
MTKNKKTILLSVGLIIILIFIVLLLRNPEKNKSPAPQPTPAATVVASSVPKASLQTTPAPTSSLHENVSQIIDLSAKTLSDEVPGLWNGLKNVWSWFTAFDAKHAIILTGVVVFLISVLWGGKKKKS